MIQIKEFFDSSTSTLSYLVFDAQTRDAIVIDPVWDYDPNSSRFQTISVERLFGFVSQEQLQVHFILETHAHADHVSGAQLLKRRWPHVQVAIGSRICEVQRVFAEIYNLAPSFACNGSQFDLLLNDEQKLAVGSFVVRVLSTPGHTPACCCYLIEDCLFTGDALFMPDSGTGRCDFPGGSAVELYQSIQEKIYTLSSDFRTFTGHDYQTGGRALSFQSTISEQRSNNIHLKSTTSAEDFVRFRQARDRSLSAPRLLLPSLQINIAAGKLPEPESNGRVYLKLPVSRSDAFSALGVIS